MTTGKRDAWGPNAQRKDTVRSAIGRPRLCQRTRRHLEVVADQL